MDYIKEIWSKQSPLEWSAAFFTLLNVYLVIRNSIWNWIWGIVSAVLYGVFFYNHRWMASFGLNILYYFPMQLIGWYWWLKGGPKRNDDLPIVRISLREFFLWQVLAVALAVPVGYLLQKYDHAQVAYVDSYVAAASIIGQILLTRKVMESWIFWIVVDLLYTFWIFPQQKAYLSAVIYFILLVMASLGWWEWEKIRRSPISQEKPVPFET